MQAQEFWNEVGSKKSFEDPIYLERLEPLISKQSKIVEYGCGWGRVLNLFYEAGYHNLTGFDFAQKMVERGKRTYPHLDLRLTKSTQLPVEDADLVVLSTVLCCVVDKQEQMAIIEALRKALRPGGLFYLTDFLICGDRYNRDDWGVYTTSEGALIRHHTKEWIMDLLSGFDLEWYEEFDFKTMNNNPARTFHAIAKLPK